VSGIKMFLARYMYHHNNKWVQIYKTKTGQLFYIRGQKSVNKTYKKQYAYINCCRNSTRS